MDSTARNDELAHWRETAVYTPPWNGHVDEDAVCSVDGCGRVAEDEGWPSLVPVTVTVLPGEEGYSEVTQIVCQRHFEWLTDALMDLGFISHNHHGTCSLDAEADCGGYGKCPTPAEYGPELRIPRNE